jgi:hypothetical protein
MGVQLENNNKNKTEIFRGQPNKIRLQSFASQWVIEYVR